MKTELGRAAVLESYGAPFEVRGFPVPEPAPGALVVKIDAATVCGSDVHVWLGHLADTMPISLPLILGHEMTGIVSAIGEGAEADTLGTTLQVGDRIVWAHAACGRCHECVVTHQPELCRDRYIGYLNDCSVAPHFTGTFAEYSYVVPSAGRIKVPSGVKSTWASAGSCALRTVVKASQVAGRISGSDSIVIQGAGPLGLFATALLSLNSPKQIIVVGGPEDRLELAREWGATHTVAIEDYQSPEERVERVLELTQGEGAELVFEFAGVRGAVAEGLRMLRRHGRYIVMGTLGAGEQTLDASLITTRGLQIQGSMSGDIADYAEALRFLDTHQDKFDWDRLIGKRYSLAQVGDAMEAMRRFEEIKPVIDPSLDAAAVAGERSIAAAS